jgi:hypothetical protein
MKAKRDRTGTPERANPYPSNAEQAGPPTLISGAPRREVLSNGTLVEHYFPCAVFFVGTAAQLRGYLEHPPTADVHRWSRGGIDFYLYRKARSGAEHKATRDDSDCSTDFWELRVFDRDFTWEDHLRHVGLC